MNTWESTPLAGHHDTSRFDCGVASLNDWLTGQALRAQVAGAARVWVWTLAREDTDRVVAFHAVCPTQVARAEVSSGMAGGYSVVPGYLLARLALDQSLRGCGLGGQLLRDALERIVDAARYGGGRLIVVDAIDEAAVGFYRHYDFQPVKGDPRRLVMKVATAAKALGV